VGYPKSLPQGCSKLRCRIDRKYVGRPGVGQHEDAQVQKDELNPCRYPSEADLEKVKNCVLKASAAPANAKPRCWARWTGPSNPSTGRSLMASVWLCSWREKRPAERQKLVWPALKDGQ
jgi:hypothetical protein